MNFTALSKFESAERGMHQQKGGGVGVGGGAPGGGAWAGRSSSPRGGGSAASGHLVLRADSVSPPSGSSAPSFNAGGGSVPHERVLNHVVSALRGFFRSITLGSAESIQDLLRLLTLWFRYGGEPAVEQAVLEGFDAVDIDMWLDVLPQIIARISSPSPRVRSSVQKLLLRVGRKHPQALIYPLAVASHEASEMAAAAPPDAQEDSFTGRGQNAVRILSAMRAHCDTLVEQALLVSTELIRVSILWGEMWHETLEQAYRRYFFTEHRSVDVMIATIEPLHDRLEQGATTANEQAFVGAYGAELGAALGYCKEFKATGDESLLQLAWETFYGVLSQLGHELADTKSLQLEQVSPKLLRAHQFELAVPGTYHAGRDVIAIQRFGTTVKVMNSKQRPRRLSMSGSDGKEYSFLLKGHEDLRQDERVMQLFGLVNALLNATEQCARLDLGIQRYSVVPLSTNSGLIEWVPQCDTLHSLVRDYRVPRNVLLNVEHRLMLHFSPDLESLSLLQKVESFKHALAHTSGMDLYRVLWMKAPSSEVWLERRSNFSRSLAVMSMVGYMLGLGDRHPSNLMLHRFTGKILHIDFGDCFEVAMRREKFPETVPFRLTRMLANAMEVSAVEGSFRSTCEAVMGVLRSHQDSLMAMLEAFIHDPLIKWRLLQPDRDAQAEKEEGVVGAGTRRGSDAKSSGGGSGGVGGSGGDGGGHSPSTGSRLASISPSLRANLEQSFGYNTDDATDPSGQHSMTTSSIRSSMRQRHPNRSLMSGVGTSGGGGTTLDASIEPEVLNERAVRVIERVKNKLSGREFGHEELSVSLQVQRLIDEATSHQNLCQCFVGWCPFW
jgi:FKBP12-rapamycin complex-associated protein